MGKNCSHISQNRQFGKYTLINVHALYYQSMIRLGGRSDNLQLMFLPVVVEYVLKYSGVSVEEVLVSG